MGDYKKVCVIPVTVDRKTSDADFFCIIRTGISDAATLF